MMHPIVQPLMQKALQIVSNAKFIKDLKVKRAFDMATKWASRNLLNEPRFVRNPKKHSSFIRK